MVDVDVAAVGDVDLWELVVLAMVLNGWTPLRLPMVKLCDWHECDDAVVVFDGDGVSADDDVMTEVCNGPYRGRYHCLQTSPCWSAEIASGRPARGLDSLETYCAAHDRH